MRATELTNPRARAIAQRLSMRAPQIAALEVLTRIYDAAQPQAGGDLATAVDTVRGVLAGLNGERDQLVAREPRHALAMVHPAEEFQAFQRECVNLCFALATGVGKTRLMGAFIAWLYLEHGHRHFLVIAPNLTIYRKLIEDFGDPSAQKYVFRGMTEFAVDRPLLITGDDYESGHGIREEARRQPSLPGVAASRHGSIHINVFNIAKLAKDANPARSGQEVGKPPRIKRLHEYIGQSYFNYLAGLNDLVLIMDEAHNYRADAAMQVLDDLKPRLGLELTATPFRVRGQRREWFQNIVYNYQLRDAMMDKWVKLPEVAYRKNRLAKTVTEQEKLDDTIALHLETKAALVDYAAEKRILPVKPFILIVASDIAHATRLQATIESPEFHGGFYTGKTIRIDSQQGAAEKARNTELLLKVERLDSPVEIVIHVESLEEGWDVNNLYTILPLRAADSPQLVLQSLGRGLRMPRGCRTGYDRVDRLTVVAHDRYNELVTEARSENSDFSGVVRFRDLDTEKPERVHTVVSEPTSVIAAHHAAAKKVTPADATPEQRDAINRKAGRVANAMAKAIDSLAGVKSMSDVTKPEVTKLLIAAVDAEIGAEAAAKGEPMQGELELDTAGITTADFVMAALPAFVEHAIEVPRIAIIPSADYAVTYAPFELNMSHVGWRPAARDLVRENMVDAKDELHYVATEAPVATEARLQNYIIRQIHNYDDIRYEDAAEIIQGLADQFVAHLLRINDGNDVAVQAVLINQEKEAGRIVYDQLVAHRNEHATLWLKTVSPSFDLLKPAVYNLAYGEQARDFRDASVEKSRIRGQVYGGFAKCAGQFCKFDSDPERRFAVLLEDRDRTVLRWMKPKTGQLTLRWRDKGIQRDYQPDFVVETTDRSWLIEVKARNELDDPGVLAKADAAREWCRVATEHCAGLGKKPWSYKIIADDKIQPGFDFNGLIATA